MKPTSLRPRLRDPALTSHVRPEQRKAAVAVNRLGIDLGRSVGPAVRGFLATVSFPLLFVVNAVMSLAAGVVLTTLLMFPPIAAIDHPVHGAGVRKSDGPSSVLHDRRAMVFLAGLFLMSLVSYQHEAAMPLFLVRDLHYRASLYGTVESASMAVRQTTNASR